MILIFSLFLSWNIQATTISLKEVQETSHSFVEKMSSFAQLAYEKPMTLEVSILWKKPYSLQSAGASFYRNHSQKIMGLAITGWVAKHFSKDGIEAVLCHELGHHFHGAGAEEHCDHFVTATCLPLLWEPPLQKSRVLSALNEIHNFRRWVFKKKYNWPDEKISHLNSCRNKVFLDGLMKLPFTPCL